MSNEELVERFRIENRNLELKIEELEKEIRELAEKGTYQEGYDAGYDDGFADGVDQGFADGMEYASD